MHRNTKFVSPFPRFNLSDRDTAQLRAFAKAFVARSLTQYEAFLTDRARRSSMNSMNSMDSSSSDVHAVDRTVWKFVKERENLRAYTSRPARPSTSSSGATTQGSPLWNTHGSSSLPRSSSSSSSASDVGPAARPAAHDDRAAVLVLGSVAGSVDDMMFGLMSNTVEAARIKNAYVEDLESDVAVLATLTAPSAERPFESVAIKWAALAQPGVVRAVVKKRDFVFLEVTGIAHLANGDRVGYHIVHSLTFAQTPELECCVRATVSVAAFCRDRVDARAGAREVELCVRGVANPRGSMLRGLAVSNLAAALLSMWRTIECATRKKLAHFVLCARKLEADALACARHRHHRRDSASSSTSSSSRYTANTANNARTSELLLRRRARRCVTCQKAPTLTSRTCAVCREFVCSACRIKKRLSHVNGLTGALEHRAFAFCSVCVHRAVTTSAFVVAQREIAARESESVDTAGTMSNGSDWFAMSCCSSDVSEVPTSTRSWVDMM